MNCITIALLGGNGGKMRGMADFQLIVPAKTSDRVQEIHTLVLHILVQMVEQQLFLAPQTEPIYV